MKEKNKILLRVACTCLGASLLTTGACLIFDAVKNKEPMQDEQVNPGVTPPDDGGEEQPLVHAMTFKVGEETLPAVNVATGGLITPPTDPTKEGYIFAGWALEGTETPVDFSTLTATENMTFVAIFQRKVLTFIFYTGEENIIHDVYYGETIKEIADPTKEGYIFAGWALEGTETPVDFSTLIATENMTFVALFEEITYQVIFSVDGKETTQQVAYQGLAVAPTDPVKEGYIFTGWALKGTTEIVDLTTTIINENTTFVAIFIEAPVKVTSASKFTFSGNTLTGYVGEDADVVIPATYSLDENGNPIDGEDIEICSIKGGAFISNKSIHSVVIPSSVKDVSWQAFEACSNLKSVTILGAIENLKTAVFKDCSNLESVVLIEGIMTIDSMAFYGCSSLKELTIPDSVTSIGDDAFCGCTSLTSITIPKSVTSIGNGAFNDCEGLVSISVDNANSVYDSRNNCNAIIETSTNTLIKGCNNSIIPDTVTSIGNGAFNCCKNLTSIAIPDSVTTLGAYSFGNCDKLTTIYVGSNLTHISGWCFGNNSGETFKVIFDSKTPATIESFAFGGSALIVELYVPDEAVDAYKTEWTDYTDQIKPVSEYVA